MRFITLVRTLGRYWKMAHDPRTPVIVRYLIYGGIAMTVSPIQLIPGAGLVEDAAILPGIIALSMVLIPKEVKDSHDAKEDTSIARKQAGA